MNNSKANKAIWFFALIALVAIAAIAIYFNRKSEGSEQADAAPAAASTGRVAFLMEQQWLIKLKLAKAVEAKRAAQILSTGRVVPVPSKRAIVAPPLSGIIQNGTMPRIGQHVAQGQQLATLIQTSTAAEVAQAQAANTQIHIENSRIDAERRRLVQLELEAKARLEEATHDLGRSQRLYEKKAYSAKALESDELARVAAAAQLEAIREQIKALQSATSATPVASSIYEVRAPISGTVMSVSKASGEQVSSGSRFWKLWHSIRYGSKRLSLRRTLGSCNRTFAQHSQLQRFRRKSFMAE